MDPDLNIPDFDEAEAEKALDWAVDLLRQHFDSVVIVATHPDDVSDQTEAFGRQKGNRYAILGSVQEWVTRDNEAVRKEIREE